MNLRKSSANIGTGTPKPAIAPEMGSSSGDGKL
jgi:hypothetical protein